jgi:hypothetical protein
MEALGEFESFTMEICKFVVQYDKPITSFTPGIWSMSANATKVEIVMLHDRSLFSSATNFLIFKKNSPSSRPSDVVSSRSSRECIKSMTSRVLEQHPAALDYFDNHHHSPS